MEKNNDLEKMLRQYLKRDITQYSKTLNGIIHRFGCDAYEFYLKLYKAFGYPQMDNVWFQPDSPLGKIYGNIRQRRENNLRTSPPFTYFDLDTLYAFDKFLEHLLVGRRFFSRKDFDRCLGETKRWLLENKRTATTGYFDERCPIVALSKPENTMSENTFDSHYSYEECRRKLNSYLLSKYGTSTPVKKEEPKPEDDDRFAPGEQLKLF